MKYVVPWVCGSSLGSIIFSVLGCDMLFMADTIDIESYVDNNSFYSVEKKQCDQEALAQNFCYLLPY